MQEIYRKTHPDQNLPEAKSASKILPVIVHAIVWVIFLSLPAIFKPRPADVTLGKTILYDILEPPRWTNALFLIVVFYFNYYVGIPLLYMRRRYLWLALSVGISFTAFYFLNALQMPDEIRMEPSGGFNALGNCFNFFMFLIVYSMSFALCLYEQWQHTKHQVLEAEISFLKAQINPHFLFNTLNSIYSLTLTKSDIAPDAVLKLSGMMRYSVSDASQSFVSLGKEMDYISNYVELQSLRLPEKVKISYEVNGHPHGKQIAPFLLIPFVENAFKYGVNPEENSDIRINVVIDNDVLRLDVFNNKVYVRKDKDNSTGLGINTTRKRLAIVYPGKHNLVIRDSSTEFYVSLQINL